MPKYKFSYGGKNYSVDDPSKIDAVVEHLKAQEGSMPKAETWDQKASDVAGKVATGAGLGSIGAAIAAQPEATIPILGGAAAGYGASYLTDKALDVLGVKPALQRASQSLRSNPITPEPQSPSVAKNFILNLVREQVDPRLAAASAIDLAPTLASSYAGMKGGMKAAGALSAPTKTPAMLALEAEGGKLTPAMTAQTPIGKGLTQAMELSARTNPLLAGKLTAIDDANRAAAQTIAQKALGADVLSDAGNVATGENLSNALSKMSEIRGQQYAPGKEALGRASAQGLGKQIHDQVIAGIEADDSLMPSSVEAFKRALKKAIPADATPKQIDKGITDLRVQFENNTKMGNLTLGTQKQIGRDFGSMLSRVKEAFYQGLGPEGEALRAAKGDYASATEGMSPIAKAISVKGGDSPESVGKALLNQGSGAVNSALDWADANNPAIAQQLRQNIARAIYQESGGSPKSLANALKKYKAIVPKLGPLDEQLKTIGEAATLSEAGAPQIVNSSKSGLVGSTIGNVALGVFNPTLLAQKAAVDAGYVALPWLQRAAVRPTLPQLPGVIGQAAMQADRP